MPPMSVAGGGGGGAAALQPPKSEEAWQEFTAPDGRKYYYNPITQENVWEKPAALKEKEGESFIHGYAIWMYNLKYCMYNLLYM